MIGVISIVLVLGGLIFFHELGHFLVARSLGIGIKTFSVGFGPALLAWKGKKTRYQLSLFPLGGYVSMVGENDAADIPAPFTLRESFANRPPLHRLLVVASGPVFNMILAVLIFWGLFWAAGAFPLAEVGEVLDDSPARQAGLLSGDLVKSIDGNNVDTWAAMYTRIQSSQGNPLHLEVERNGQILDFTILPEKVLVEENGQTFDTWRIGVSPSGRARSLDFFDSAVQGARETWRLTGLIGQFVGRMFSGQGSLKEIGGPVLVAQMVHRQAERGLADLLYLTAFLSINLGLLNLLPVPALDGGHVLFCLIELAIRRPVPMRIQAVCIYAGFALLISLMLMATAFDIFRILQ
ncbi:MAG: RIP metalloprotease RseP [Deltaproteobacteria bacterium]|jgi:regulator of sigma E protease|nr:RIP metalloprotease RseP [Deltaproteobacteria bacterium]